MSKPKKPAPKNDTVNKITERYRRKFALMIEEELNQLCNHIPTLEANGRTELLLKLLPYALPKFANIELDAKRHGDNEVITLHLDGE
ncbi:MAG: hypothetical protein JWO06_1476 [Bacteroidota bacterium]|nr:hypothetical protein [Bacteroidota bacterium]